MLGVQSPFTFHRAPAILATPWAAKARDAFTAASRPIQADRRFIVRPQRFFPPARILAERPAWVSGGRWRPAIDIREEPRLACRSSVIPVPHRAVQKLRGRRRMPTTCPPTLPESFDRRKAVANASKDHLGKRARGPSPATNSENACFHAVQAKTAAGWSSRSWPSRRH